MTILNCKHCGYRVSAKSKCVWCENKRDTLENLNTQEVLLMHKRYAGLSRKGRTEYTIALGLEGFTPDEISVITNCSVESIQEVLINAQVYKP